MESWFKLEKGFFKFYIEDQKYLLEFNVIFLQYFLVKFEDITK